MGGTDASDGPLNSAWGLQYPRCPWCGGAHEAEHPGECPRVEAVEYYPNGAIKRVELRIYDNCTIRVPSGD